MSTPPTLESVYRSRDAVITREIVGETLLVPISAELANLDAIFALNETAAYLWHRLDGERSLGQLRDAVVERYEVESEQAWQDMTALLDELHARRLVEQVR